MAEHWAFELAGSVASGTFFHIGKIQNKRQSWRALALRFA
jgi:hypothetical protein